MVLATAISGPAQTGIIKSAFLAIDEYKTATTDGKKWIVELEAREKEYQDFKKKYGLEDEIKKTEKEQIKKSVAKRQSITGRLGIVSLVATGNK